MAKRTAKKETYCKKPDKDFPEMICGYPRPCPYHTVIIHADKEPPTVEIPATIPEAANPDTLNKLKRIAHVLKTPAREGGNPMSRRERG